MSAHFPLCDEEFGYILQISSSHASPSYPPWPVTSIGPQHLCMWMGLHRQDITATSDRRTQPPCPVEQPSANLVAMGRSPPTTGSASTLSSLNLEAGKGRESAEVGMLRRGPQEVQGKVSRVHRAASLQGAVRQLAGSRQHWPSPCPPRSQSTLSTPHGKHSFFCSLRWLSLWEWKCTITGCKV